jgi:tetratricopeptide (TPR) repeat protein
MTTKKNILAYTAISVSFLICFYISMSYESPYPKLGINSNIISNPVDYIFAVSFGQRKSVSDLLFIRIMQYYGTKEIAKGAKRIAHSDGHGHIHYHYEGEGEFGSGHYPLFYPMTLNLLFLNPYYKEFILYSSASMAFNLNKEEEAISILENALQYYKEIEFYKLLLAIGYSKAKDKVRLAEELYPIAMQRETPVIVKNLTAFLNKKANKNREALNIYRLILETTKDEYYIDKARKNIAELENNKNEDYFYIRRY